MESGYPDAAYFDHNYGTCALTPCQCLLEQRWIGEACPNWKPLRVRSWAELRAHIIAEKGDPNPSGTAPHTS